MVKIYEFLWLRYIDYAAKYQLAVDSVTSFNGKIDEVQREAITTLSPYYQKNEKVRSLLEPWVRNITGTSPSNGQIPRPTVVSTVNVEFYRVISLGVTDVSANPLYPIHEIMENEIMLVQNIPQRAPDLTKKRAYYIAYKNILQLYPQAAIPYSLFFFIYPLAALLVFTYSQVNGEFVQTYDPTNTIDLAWDKDASNLLLYMLLEKYGISSRDDLLAEFGKLGIQMALTDLNPA